MPLFSEPNPWDNIIASTVQYILALTPGCDDVNNSRKGHMVCSDSSVGSNSNIT